MTLMRPDPTFYPSARDAMKAARERYAYVGVLNPGNGKNDGLAVVDLDPESSTYSQILSTLEFPGLGHEVHHFGWNACSSALCPSSAHPHLERRYLIVPTLRTSQIFVVDTRPDPTRPHVIKTIDANEIAEGAGYSRLHTVHCGPDAIYVNALGGTTDGEGPGGVFMLDHFTFDVLGPWEADRGPQYLAYDFWWHITQDVMVTSEWGTPNMFEDGLKLEDVVGQRYGHQLHFWDMRKRKHVQTVDLGPEYQMTLELRPAHDPTKTHGFVGVVTNTKDLGGSIWTWYRENGEWKATKTIDIPAQPADEANLPDALKPLKAVPPLITDIDLSLDDRFLYVSCWGTGELQQYDVSDPFNPRLTGSVHLGGVTRKAAHPNGTPLTGGPQMVEISRDGRRVYLTNSLYSTWDDQFYPGLKGWLAKIDVGPDGGMDVDPDFFIDFGDTRSHQVRLEGGDASTDSYCFP
ncbi:MAG TPA: selenium-binding protein SBP56-related protein [Anaerolineae bacterium]|nr:selenium-binding protein SBP56-related protein [Anaerolineae bacterium]